MENYNELFSIKSLREMLTNILIELKDEAPINLEIDKEVMREILLNEEDNSFAIPFELVKRLDLSNFSFDDVSVRSLDFRNSYGVVINPQKVYNKDLSYCILEGATVKGSMDNVLMHYTNFRGTEGIKVNPQTSRGKNISGAILDGVEIIGSLSGVYVRGTEFNGSKGAILNPHTVLNCDLNYTDLTNVIIINDKDYPSVYTIHKKQDKKITKSKVYKRK